MNYLTIKGNFKTKKVLDGYLPAELSLAPASESGYNVCKFASDGCKKACIGWFSGRNVMQIPRNAKIRKTKEFFENRQMFMIKLAHDIAKLEKKAIKKGLKLIVRLNCYSDIRWENIKIDSSIDFNMNLMERFPNVQFYDYTKDYKRFEKQLPANYHLTFSRSESNEKHVNKILKLGYNVAVVFKTKPDVFKGKKVIDGDIHDLRFLDPQGVIVGLTPKGKGKKDESGFVVDTVEIKEIAV